MNKPVSDGFTLIELVVVLAVIAVLITLVLIGVRSAQAAQRDVARKEIVGQLSLQLQVWTDNAGTYPTYATFDSDRAGGFFGPTCTASSGKGITVSGRCLGLDGLGFNVATDVLTTPCPVSRPAAFPTTDLVLCYGLGVEGRKGYSIGVYLEGSPTLDVVSTTCGGPSCVTP